MQQYGLTFGGFETVQHHPLGQVSGCTYNTYVEVVRVRRIARANRCPSNTCAKDVCVMMPCLATSSIESLTDIPKTIPNRGPGIDLVGIRTAQCDF